MIRILLADDKPRVRFALRVLLEQLPGVAVVGKASDRNDRLNRVEITLPNVVLLDWELPGVTA